MRINTLLFYLIGDRRAIEEIASDRRALWLGLLFVLSAGFAREYDGEDLLHEPWHLLLPLGASLVSSFILFTICFWKIMATGAPRPAFFSGYLSFLGLFWMTAPLAWLYAIPYERFLSAPDAVRANLWTLGLVAAWRVVLMIRVVSVLMGYRILHAVFLVMALADALAEAAVWHAPGPIIQVMGGIRYSESTQVLRVTRANVMFVGCISLPVWLLGAMVCVARSRPAWPVPSVRTASQRPPAWGLFTLAIFSLLVWLPLLPMTQPEQQTRWQVERYLKTGQIAEALAEMSLFTPEDFPPNWAPPSREEGDENAPRILEVMERLVERPPKPWVRSLYLEKLDRLFQDPFIDFKLSTGNIKKLIHVLQRLPEGRTFASQHQRAMRNLLGRSEIPLEDYKTLTELAGLKDDKTLTPPPKK